MKKKEKKKEKRKRKKQENLKVKLENSYTKTICSSFNNKVIYTCKCCIQRSTNLEVIKNHIIEHNHFYKKNIISLYEEWENLDRRYGLVSSP